MPEEDSEKGTGELFEDSLEQSRKHLVGGRDANVHYAGKYAPLARYLDGLKEQVCMLQFNEVEEIVGSALPRSACQKRTGWLWWSNDFSRTQARNGWLAVGWIVSKVDYAKCVVYMNRTGV